MGWEKWGRWGVEEEERLTVVGGRGTAGTGEEGGEEGAEKGGEGTDSGMQTRDAGSR